MPIVIIGNIFLEKICKNIRVKNIYLIIASLIFYWFGGSSTEISLIVFLVIANYYFGYLIRTKKSKSILATGVLLNVLILIYFKYPQQIFAVLGNPSSEVSILMPLGISFIIFHCISYLIDIYNSFTSEEGSKIEISELDHFINSTLYFLFFPKLLQGPITLFRDFQPFLNSRKFNYETISLGLERFIIGLSKKVLLADELFMILEDVGMTFNIDTPTAWLVVLVYGLRLYFDFSGYSDMALGVGQMLGVYLPENFNKPYLSRSISEFWNRWHMSLGNWFTNYIYIPLGGNRSGNVFVNLFTIFVISGLWHGNTSLYFLWGVAHGVLVAIERSSIYQKIDFSKSVNKIIGHLFTLFFVFIGWMCFYLPDLDTFKIFVKRLIGVSSDVEQIYFSFQYFLDKKTIMLLIISIVGIVLTNTEFFKNLKNKSNNQPALYLVKVAVLLLLFILSFWGMNVNSYTPFIYFQY